MNRIEQLAIKQYQINLKYFEKNHPELYKKLTLFNSAIENGSYKEKYALEYINPYFDIRDISSGNYLYNQDTNKYAKKLAENITYKRSEQVIEGFYNRPLSEEFVNKSDDKINLRNNLFASAKIMYYHDKVISKDYNMKDLFKFIYCDVGLGLHIEAIQKKVQSKVLLIIEKDLELFHLSCFTTNYKKIGNEATLFFTIMDNDENFKKVFDAFFTTAYTHNHFIKYSLLFENNLSTIKNIQNIIVSSKFLIYPYAKLLKETLKAPEYLVEQYPFFDVRKHKEYQNPFKEKAILIIGAGPSLKHNADWLKKNANRFIIISVLAAVRSLYKIGVKPDIVTHMDGNDISSHHLEDIDTKSFFDKTLFLFSSITPKNIINRLEKTQIYFFETASHYKKIPHIPSGSSIGETSYALSLVFGAKEVYLLGLDLALDPETKSSHSDDHAFSRTIDDSEENPQTTTLQNSIFFVKGNLRELVPTNNLFNISAKIMNDMSKSLLQDNQKVYNLNDGAYFEGTIPLKPENFDMTKLKIIKKDTSFEELKKLFQNISQDKMTDEEKKNINAQLDEAQRLLNIIKIFEEKVKTNDIKSYLANYLYPLYQELLRLNHEGSFDINYIFSSYMQTISSYIFDVFNTTNLPNEKEHVKNMNDIYLYQLKRILILYIQTMKVYQAWMEKEEV